MTKINMGTYTIVTLVMVPETTDQPTWVFLSYLLMLAQLELTHLLGLWPDPGLDQKAELLRSRRLSLSLL